MVFRLVTVGRMRDANLRGAGDDYQRRLTHYVNFELHECAEGGSGNPELVLAREGSAILKNLQGFNEVVLLTRNGRRYSSRSFADAVRQWHEGARDVAFVIGGALGVSQDVSQRATGTLSLATMTWPHEIARVLFLEQLYRANTIRRGEPYHKGD